MLGLAVLGAVVLAGVGASVPAAAAVSQTYIVVLDDSVTDPAAAAAAAGVTPTYVYRHALKGYAAPMTSATASAIAGRLERPVDRARASRTRSRRHRAPPRGASTASTSATSR